MNIMNINNIKELIPISWIEFYKKTQIEFDKTLLRIFSLSGFTSSLYFFVFSRKFYLEHRSVLKGRLKYLDDKSYGRLPRYLLRRNIHRLEKGLLMRPRKDIFATTYINETVSAYKKCKQGMRDKEDINEEIVWARDVLSQYFDVVDLNNKKIARAKKDFEDNTVHIRNNFTERKVPYLLGRRSYNLVNTEQFLTLVNKRKSVRWYEKKSVPRDLIDQAIFAASMSPSACNRQPYEFWIFDQPDDVKKIASIPWGTLGFVDNIPAVAVIVGKLDAFFDERDRHLIYIDSSLAAMTFILALETMGIGSCALNWPDVENNETKMARELRLEQHERVIMLIAFGYPDPEGEVAYSQKKTLEELRIFEN
jgi:nitroreductase